MLESGAFLYSKANGAMQAYDAARAARRHTTAGTVVHFRKQFQWMWPRLFGACIAATMILGIGVPTGWSQQARDKAHELELARGASMGVSANHGNTRGPAGK